MTERLSTLLRDEAAGIDVPVPDPTAVVRRARGMRRRRHGVELLVGLTVVGLAATGLLVGVRGDRGDRGGVQSRYADAPADAAYREYGAYSVGSVVHIGNHQIRFDQKIKALYYTSAGVLVRRGKVAETDAPGASLYTLVRPDGSTEDVDLRMGDRVPGTDPDSPYVAYAEPHGASTGNPHDTTSWDLVAVDLRTGAEAARTTVGGAFTWGGWEAPPVTTAGTRMWALFDQGWVEFDWAAGTTRTVPGTRGASLEAAHGRYLLRGARQQDDWRIIDFVSGRTVATVPHGRDDYGTLSTTGGYLRFDGTYTVDESGTAVGGIPDARFLSLATGRVVTIGGYRWGWTPEGNALAVDQAKGRIVVCDPADGSCRRVSEDIPAGRVKLGGLSYES